MKRVIACLAGLVVGGVVVSDAAGVRYIAHRGDQTGLPENTMLAFSKAKERGANGFECDARLTADGKIVCMNDATTKRTCTFDDDQEANLVISESTLAELKELSAGYKKNGLFKSEKIPTLAEALTLVDESFEVFVEIKVGVEIIPELVSVMSGISAEKRGRVRFIAFTPSVLEAVRNSLPECEVYWMTNTHLQSNLKLSPEPASIFATLADIGASGVSLQDDDNLSPAYIAAIKDAGYSAHVWTINNYTRARELAGMGIDSITSNMAVIMSGLERGEEVLPEPLVHWDFEGGSTANLGTGGSAYDATLVGTWDFGDGVDGGDAIYFEGSERGYASVEHTLGDQGTIAFWFHPDRFYNYNSVVDNSVHSNYWEMWFDETSTLRLRVRDSEGNIIYGMPGKHNGTNAWYHIAMVWGRYAPNNQMRLYINGVLRSSAVINEWTEPGTTVGFGGMPGNDPCQGKFDDIRIYEVPLSDEQIASVHRSVASRKPVIHIPLAGTDDIENLGSGGERYDAILHGDPVDAMGWEMQGSSTYLDGVDDLVELPYRLNNSATVSLWCYLEGPWYNYISVFDNSVHDNSLESWIDINGIISFRVETHDNSQQISATAGLGSGTNRWHHIACTWDAVTSNMYLYVDGELRGAAHNHTGVAWRNAGESFYLGGGHQHNVFGRYRALDLQIYEAALSPDQVADIYQGWMSGEMLAYVPLNNSLENLASEREVVAVGDYSFAPGKVKRGIEFSEPNPPGDGGSYVALSNVLGSCRGTIAFWYYAKAPFYNYQPVFDNKAHQDRWESWIYDNGEMAIRQNNIHPGSNGDTRYNLNNIRGGNQWYHITYAWNLPKGRARLYIDGVLVRTANLWESSWIVPDPTLNLGSYHTGNKAANGKWDEVRVYNYELSFEEVRELQHIPPPERTLILVR